MKNLIKLLFLTILLSPSITNADSPLTSIEFWRSSKNKYVLKIGNKTGKQKLNKSIFKFLVDPKINTFDKFCLVNSMGWEYKSENQNHLLFLKFIQKGFNRKNIFPKNHFDYENPIPYLLELGETYFIIYEYLKAMDNYTNVLEVKNEILLNTSPYLNPQIHFIFILIDLQDKLINSDFCSVYEGFTSFISYECFKEIRVKKALGILEEYINQYSSYCDTISVYLESSCNVNIFKVGSNQNLEIVNYPVFVYGTMKVFNDKNQLIIEEYCSGDDLFFITAKTLQLGYYKIVLVDDNLSSYNLFINVLDYE
jgi:hypothetical protein